MPGIESALVQYDEVLKPGFQRERIVTALVTILPNETYQASDQQIQTIRETVANAKAGLTAQEVCVTDLSSGRSYAGPMKDWVNIPRSRDRLRWPGQSCLRRTYLERP